MIRVRNLVKEYAAAGPGAAAVRALDGVDLDVARGESVALAGASGSGKSTLLHLIGGLDLPSSGTLDVDGRSLTTLGDAELSRFRRERLGFVFQFFHLLPSLTVLENILLPGQLAHLDERTLNERAAKLIARVGLQSKEGRFPDALSGGQQQRVALARALVTQPALLLADEPTGNLDSANSTEVLKLLTELVREHQLTLVLATHAADALAIADRVVHLKDGKIVS